MADLKNVSFSLFGQDIGSLYIGPHETNWTLKRTFCLFLPLMQLITVYNNDCNLDSNCEPLGLELCARPMRRNHCQPVFVAEIVIPECLMDKTEALSERELL